MGHTLFAETHFLKRISNQIEWRILGPFWIGFTFLLSGKSFKKTLENCFIFHVIIITTVDGSSKSQTTTWHV